MFSRAEQLILKGKTIYLGFSYSKDILKRFSWLFFMSSTNSEIVRSVVTDVVFYLVPIKLLLFKADDDVSFSSSSWVFPSVLGSSSPNQKIVPYTKNYFYCFKLRFWSFFFMHRIALDSFWGMVFNVFWHHVLFSQWTKNAKKKPPTKMCNLGELWEAICFSWKEKHFLNFFKVSI